MLIFLIYSNNEAFCYAKMLYILTQKCDFGFNGKKSWHPSSQEGELYVLVELAFQGWLGSAHCCLPEPQPSSWPQRCCNPHSSSVSRPHCWAAATVTKDKSLTGAKGASSPAPWQSALNTSVTASAKERLGKGQSAASKPSANLQLYVQHL